MNRSNCTAENRTGSIHLNLENLSASITKSMTDTEAQFLELGESLQHIYSQSGNLIKGVTGAGMNVVKKTIDMLRGTIEMDRKEKKRRKK